MKCRQPQGPVTFLAMAIGVGTACGVALQDVAVGFAIGCGIGAVALVMARRKPPASRRG